MRTRAEENADEVARHRSGGQRRAGAGRDAGGGAGDAGGGRGAPPSPWPGLRAAPWRAPAAMGRPGPPAGGGFRAGGGRELLERLSVPHSFLPPLAQPATKLGTLRPAVAEETGLPADVPVICPATHDTAAAVVATPGEGDDWAFLSAGTWCLFGAEVDGPRLDPSVLEAGFGNEGGVRGTIRLLRNITGLWLVQECRRYWASEAKDLGYAELARLAAE